MPSTAMAKAHHLQGKQMNYLPDLLDRYQSFYRLLDQHTSLA